MLEEEYEKKRRLPFHLRRRPEPEGPFSYVIRAAEERDIPDIREIYNYYVRNSVVTFDLAKLSQQIFIPDGVDFQSENHII